MASTWTDDRIEHLKMLWSDGKSASQIAALLGETTRNAVIGKIHRLGLIGRKGAPRKPALYRPASRESTLLYTIPRPPKLSQINCAVKATVAKYVAGPLGGVTFADLEPGMCKFPLGNLHDKPERFCGASVLKTATRVYPYCAECAAKAYRSATSGVASYYGLITSRKAA